MHMESKLIKNTICDYFANLYLSKLLKGENKALEKGRHKICKVEFH